MLYNQVGYVFKWLLTNLMISKELLFSLTTGAITEIKKNVRVDKRQLETYFFGC